MLKKKYKEEDGEASDTHYSMYSKISHPELNSSRSLMSFIKQQELSAEERETGTNRQQLRRISTT